MKVLVVEDNSRLSERIQSRLEKLYVIDFAYNGNDALNLLSSTEYDAVTLDLGLPDMNGVDLCKKIRALDIHTPILVITGNSESSSIVELLESGADDYITKPFNPSELKARIAALVRRRVSRKVEPVLKYGDVEINRETRDVKRNGITVNLRRKEFDILEYLILNSGRILTREMIMSHAWSSSTSSWNSTVDVHIKHLRDKIDRPFDKHIIKTVYGLGYKVDADK